MRRVFTKNELEEYAAFAHGVEGDMAKTILAERAEREKNPGVWDDAQEFHSVARVVWQNGAGVQCPEKIYTRTLPKTKAREIAEAKARIWANGSQSVDYQKNMADIIESAINEAMGGGK